MANKSQAQRVQAVPTAQILPSLNPFLGLLPKDLWNRVKDFFIYSVEFLPLAASETLTTDIAIQADSDFLIMAGVRTVTDTANTTLQTFVPQTVLITDSGSGRQLMDRAVHIENLFGTAQLPAIWPYPKLIRASSTLSTRLTNLDGANARNVRLSYLGFKIFGFSG